jgi:hypothetical protein
MGSFLSPGPTMEAAIAAASAEYGVPAARILVQQVSDT